MIYAGIILHWLFVFHYCTLYVRILLVTIIRRILYMCILQTSSFFFRTNSSLRGGFIRPCEFFFFAGLNGAPWSGVKRVFNKESCYSFFSKIIYMYYIIISTLALRRSFFVLSKYNIPEHKERTECHSLRSTPLFEKIEFMLFYRSLKKKKISPDILRVHQIIYSSGESLYFLFTYWPYNFVNLEI
jgi:hypothetical protein